MFTYNIKYNSQGGSYMKDKFEVTPELIKRRRDKYAEREKLLFLAMCSKRDRMLIEGEENLTIEDFD